VPATVTATYRIQYQNDGQNADAFVITGTGSTAAFAVQYLDGTLTDRTVAVTSGGYTDAVFASGASTTWTLNVTPLAAGGPGGLTHTVDVTATSVGDGTRTDQVRTLTTCISPNLAMTKSVDLSSARPGEDIVYSVVANATGLSDATSIVVVDSIPDFAGLRLTSVGFNPGTTSLTSAVSYSDDDGATWTYVPASGACGAPAGYDYCVTHVRWTLSGIIQPSQSFTLGMVVRIK
jgi:trimeric autotransporter adhesin